MLQRNWSSGVNTPVTIVSEHVLFSDALSRAMLAAGWTAVDPEGTVAGSSYIRPHAALALVDIDSGDLVERLALIRLFTDTGVRVLLLTGRMDLVRIARGLEQGALGYHATRDGFERLLERAGQLAVADAPLDPFHRHELLEMLNRDRITQRQRWAPFERLTARERATLRALAEGRSVAELARAWVVSEATMRSHVRGVLSKLGVPSQLAAVALAMECGWLAQAADAVRSKPGRLDPEGSFAA